MSHSYNLGKFFCRFRELLVTQVPGFREGLTLPSGLSEDSGLWPLCELFRAVAAPAFGAVVLSDHYVNRVWVYFALFVN